MTLKLLSPSQIDTFDGCARKWGWKYIARIETPQHASAALGTEIDDTQLQPFLRDGRPLDFSRPSGEIAQSIVQWLPAPQSNSLEVQRHFIIPSPKYVDGKHTGLGYQGFVDLWLPKGGLPCIEPLEDGTVPPVVVDFKSTGDLKWAKTEADLRKDTQAQTYAFWAMYATKSKVVDLVWLYMRTRGARQGMRVHLRAHREDVVKHFLDIDQRAQRIQMLKETVTDPLELPATPSHCDAYGGCPYRDRCNLGPGEIADAAAANAQRRRGEENMSEVENSTAGLLARLRAKRTDGGTAPPAPPPPPPAAVTEAGIPVANLPSWATAPVDPMTGKHATPGAPAVVGVNPPEKDLPPAPPVGTAPATPATPAPTGDAPVKRGPGRPRKTPATTPATPAEEIVSIPPATLMTPAKQLELPPPVEAEPIDVSGGDLLESVSVTWAEETVSPVPYHSYKVGPFEVTGFLRQGETVSQAAKRLYDEIESFAEGVRATKAASFAHSLRQASK